MVCNTSHCLKQDMAMRLDSRHETKASALTPTLSPRRGSASDVPAQLDASIPRPQPSAVSSTSLEVMARVSLQTMRRKVLPLMGERVGVRADQPQNHSFLHSLVYGSWCFFGVWI